MVNLKEQYLDLKDEIDAAILHSVASTKYINGPEVGQFEKDFANYLGVKHVISCANGTDALQLAFMALDLEEGDEVITPSFTYAATAEILGLLKLTPVFVDVDPYSFNIDTERIEKSITAKTKAILPVHLYGLSAEMDRIKSIADKYGLYVVEDTAQACGAQYSSEQVGIKKAGSMGAIGTFSFFPSKNLGCFGDGGALCTNNDQLAKKIRMLSKHGQIEKYKHEILGCNSRLDSIQAAVLNVKLQHLDTYNEKRRQAALIYNELLSDVNSITCPSVPDKSTHVYHQYTIQYEHGRDGLQQHLKENGISSTIYYPIPLHQQKAFVAIPHRKGELEVTEEIKEKVISLPIDTSITKEQQEYICNTIKNYLNK
ncbi:MAG: DegT/DnrJ/EryC1/StrS family aminotransferase [Bacteroidia bacterium]